MEAIKGSVDLTYDVDNVILFNRKKSPDLPLSETRKAIINIDGVRDVGKGGVVKLLYNEEFNCYEEV